MPFDKYQRPGSAKYWLSKYPATDASQDEYEQEFIYIDELDARIQNSQKNYGPSEKWKKTYNEHGWFDDNPVTESYGSIAGASSEEITKQYGRGNKIDPSHYINPRFYKHGRVLLPSPYIHPDLRKRMGPLKNILSMPPEEQSAFKLWNPWNMAGGIGIILLTKEYFLIGHGFWHALLFWGAWSIIITCVVDWCSWWFALRGQEWYDQEYFPLNESTNQLFHKLDKMASRPALTTVFASMIPYMSELAMRTVEKNKKVQIATAHITAVEKLSTKLKEESSTKSQVSNEFKEKSFQQALSFYEKDDIKSKYMESALSSMTGKIELKPGVTEVQAGSTEFLNKYKDLFANVETEYYASHRKAGTLPWALATDKEIEAKKMGASEKQKIYDDKIAAFSRKYHAVVAAPRFA